MNYKKQLKQLISENIPDIAKPEHLIAPSS